MLIVALTLIGAGVLLTAIGLFHPWPLDFAVAVTKGWHVTLFPPPPFVGVLVTVSGVVVLLVSFVRR